MAVSHVYPFADEKSRLYSQELIEYVLQDFGHVWKAQRTERERHLLEANMPLYNFCPDTGKVVAYFSRKYGGFVIMVCYDAWKYIKSHKVCAMGELLFNEIVSLCMRCDLEDDDFGVFIFLAIGVEFARFVIVDEQEHLVESVVKALSYCLREAIPGGYLRTLQKLRFRAPRFLKTPSFLSLDSEMSFATRASTTESGNTPISEFGSPLSFDVPCSPLYKTTKEEIEIQFRKREFHREIYKRKMRSLSSSESRSVGSTSDSSHLDSGFKSTPFAIDEKFECRGSLNSSLGEENQVILKAPPVRTAIHKDVRSRDKEISQAEDRRESVDRTSNNTLAGNSNMKPSGNNYSPARNTGAIPKIFKGTSESTIDSHLKESHSKVIEDEIEQAEDALKLLDDTDENLDVRSKENLTSKNTKDEILDLLLKSKEIENLMIDSGTSHSENISPEPKEVFKLNM